MGAICNLALKLSLTLVCNSHYKYGLHSNVLSRKVNEKMLSFGFLSVDVGHKAQPRKLSCFLFSLFLFSLTLSQISYLLTQ